MSYLKLTYILLAFFWMPTYAQNDQDDKKQISKLIESYSRCVIERDSLRFYELFNDGPVVWAAVLAERSAAREKAELNDRKPRSNYSSGSYKGFMRAILRYGSTADKFDNIRIVTDGSVAAVTMDYSFWAEHKMTNWGGKYLCLVKRDGKWKITSVIYSIELSNYYPQPPLKIRKGSNHQ